MVTSRAWCCFLVRARRSEVADRLAVDITARPATLGGGRSELCLAKAQTNVFFLGWAVQSRVQHFAGRLFVRQYDSWIPMCSDRV
jgi:hypothetical protein